MKHRQHELSHKTEPAWVTESVAYHTSAINRGLIKGREAMANTPGLWVNPAHETSVIDVAIRRLLTQGIPLSATLGEILDQHLDVAVHTDVRPMAMATPPGIPRCPSLSAAAGGEANDAAQ